MRNKKQQKCGIWHITFVTTMIVNTSPLLKGRSCSDVPLKLYLATHSVPCGHGVYGKMCKSPISKQIFNRLLIRHVLNHVVYVSFNMYNCLYNSRGLAYLDLCHGEVVRSSHRWRFLAANIRAGKHTHALPTERIWIESLGRPRFRDIHLTTNKFSGFALLRVNL